MARAAVPFEVHPVPHPSGARAYVVVEPASREALVVDPVLEDVGEVLRVLGARRATLRWVVDTHLHGDHLSGAALLRLRTGAEVAMSAAAGAAAVTRAVGEGDRLDLGETGLVVRAAPGLSPEAIVLQGPGVVFTGDTLLVGTIGVRDVPGGDGAALHETLQRVFDPLPDDTVVHPGHDDMGRVSTTVKAERRGNRWLRERDHEAFLARWASDPRPVPREARERVAANREGVTQATPDLAPARTVGTPAKGEGPVVAPQGMGAPEGMRAPAGPAGRLVPVGVADLLVAGGALAVAGCALGYLLHPLFHLVAGLVGVAAVGAGLARASRRPKGAGPGLYYTGPLPRTPAR